MDEGAAESQQFISGKFVDSYNISVSLICEECTALESVTSSRWGDDKNRKQYISTYLANARSMAW